MSLVRAGLVEDREPRPGGDYTGGEMAANGSLGWPLALVGAKLTTCLTETFAAVPQKRPAPARKERW